MYTNDYREQCSGCHERYQLLVFTDMGNFMEEAFDIVSEG